MKDSDEPNQWEIGGRWDKAWKIAHYLKRLEVSHESCAGWSKTQWVQIAAAVGLKPPSQKTQGIVIGLLTPKPELRKQNL